MQLELLLKMQKYNKIFSVLCSGAQLILSTAHPSLGGKIPDLNTLEAVIVDNFAPQRRQRRW